MSAFRRWVGEKLTFLGLWLSFDRKVYHNFHDVIVRSPNGTTQIDLLIVSPFGVFVIEEKDYSGWIFGSKDDAYWTQSLYGQSFSFQNPLFQNYRHTKCLAEYLHIDHSLLQSVVLFSRRCTFQTDLPSNVLQEGLASYISEFRKQIIMDDDVRIIVKLIESLKADPSLNDRDHLRSLRERYESTTKCPKCEGRLLERVAKKGVNVGERFLGCSGYPKCRYIKKR
jgi:hypothetical protein